VSPTDNITKVTTPAFTGTAVAGITVTIFSDGSSLAQAPRPVGILGTTSTLTQGVHLITAQATDAAGNVSTTSGSLQVTIDTTAPTLGSNAFINDPNDAGHHRPLWAPPIGISCCIS